jgi:hypothetical protein
LVEPRLDAPERPLDRGQVRAHPGRQFAQPGRVAVIALARGLKANKPLVRAIRLRLKPEAPREKRDDHGRRRQDIPSRHCAIPSQRPPIVCFSGAFHQPVSDICARARDTALIAREINRLRLASRAQP